MFKKLIIISSIGALVGCATTEVKDYSHAIDLTNNTPSEHVYWVKTTSDYPLLPMSITKAEGYACAKFSLVISESGQAENIELLKSYPNRLFANRSKKSLKKTRWEATEFNSDLTPVKIAVTFDAMRTDVKPKHLCE